MLRYALDVTTCRKSLMMEFFQLDDKDGNCNTCDNCCSKFGAVIKQVGREYWMVVSILKAAAEADEKMTLLKLVDAWNGKKTSQEFPYL